MLNHIIKFALNNRLLIIVISVAIILFGTYVASRMEIDVFPDLTAPTVVVFTHRAVAARGALDEASALVEQIGREAVDLRLGDEAQLFLGGYLHRVGRI